MYDEKLYCVYILECSDKSYYTGISSNMESRLYQHQEGVFPTCYTYSRRPVKLLFCSCSDDVFSAIAAEKMIKGWTRKKKEALIAGDSKLLHELAECKNSTHYKNRES